MTSIRSARWVLILLAALFVGSGCGGDDGDTESSGPTTTAQGSVETDITVAVDEEEQPQYGGNLVFGLAAETSGWNPTADRWGPAAFNVTRAIYDPLTVIDTEGVARPYLVESIEPNGDFTEWTITIRDNVFFHNGDQMTAEHLAEYLKTMQTSLLTAFAYDPVGSIAVPGELAQIQFDEGEITQEELDLVLKQVVMTTRDEQPWATFPAILSSQAGYFVHPGMFPTADGPPTITEPVGTGPFMWTDEWVTNDHLTVERNPDYWREGLPYLDSIEFQPIVDPNTRHTALTTGAIDMFHTNSADQVIEFSTTPPDDLQVVIDRSSGDEWHVTLDTQSGPTSDINVRRALALALDREALNEQLYGGFFELADGPYRESDFWWSDSGWPEPDMAEAQRLVEEWEANNGEDLEIELKAILSSDNQELAQVVSEFWTQAGVTVVIEVIDEATFSNDLLLGNFDAIMSAFYNRSNPGEEFHFWDPDRIGDPGELSLNFPRYTSQTIGDALHAARATDDPDAQKAEYAKVWTDWGENFPYLWLYHAQWVIEADDDLRGLTTFTFPNGEAASPMDWGAIFLTSVWQAT